MMSKLLPFLALLICALPLFAEDIPARVIRVADGDTMAVLIHGRVQTVRLNGIDCPENGQSYGGVAKRIVEEATEKKVVMIRSYTTDKHGRIIGDIFLDKGESLAQRLFRSGACRKSRSAVSHPKQ